MVANLRRNITRIFGKNINNHHIIAILKRWHHRENNRWGFVGTIIAYLRHASDRGGVATLGWQHLRRFQPGANHNRVPTARCSFHSPHRPKLITARHRTLFQITASALARSPETNHCTTSDIDSHHGIGTRPPPETNHCTASDIVSNHGIGF